VAAVYNFTVDQGSTVRFSFTWRHNTGTADAPVWTPYDLAGCTARMQVRQARGKPVIFEVSSESTNGSITVEPGGATGKLDIWLSDENTDLLDLKITKYDIEITFPGGDVQRVLEGRITSNPSITKDGV
jgi:hypothetical protein